MNIATATAWWHKLRATSIRRRRSVSVVLAATGLLAAAVCAPSVASAATGKPSRDRATAAGVTPTSVLIGSDQPLTGPAADGYHEIAPASRAFFDFVNSRGGVFGRAITYTFLDDATDPTTAVADERQLVDGDHVFAYFNAFGNAEHASIVDTLNAQRVPDLFVGSSCACWNEPQQRPETFAFGADYPAEGRLAGNYVARTFATAKVAYIWENGAVGCCQQAVQEQDSEIPASQVVTREPFTTDELPTDRLLPQIRAAQAAGAQVLLLDTLAPAAVALALLDAGSIGYHPTIVDPFHLGADPTTVAGLIQRFSGGRASPALEDGLITLDYLPSASDAANPWIALFRRIHDTYDPQNPFDNLTVYGMAAAYTFTKALRAAGPNPTRQSIVAAVDAGAVDAGGPGLAPLQYSPLNHGGYAGIEVGRVNNGAVVLAGPVFLTHDTGPIITVAPDITPPPHHI
jgi:ABC-type branched-subunit amino acid transport system substrate-binding protein